MEVADGDETVRFLETRLRRSLVEWGGMMVRREDAGEGVVDESVDEGREEMRDVFADSDVVFSG